MADFLKVHAGEGNDRLTPERAVRLGIICVSVVSWNAQKHRGNAQSKADFPRRIGLQFGDTQFFGTRPNCNHFHLLLTTSG